MNPRTSSPPLYLTIRFSTSLPDIDLDIPSPQSTTVLSLKHILRQRLSTRNRIRLIHQGRLLPDTSALSAVLRPLLPPPPPPPTPSSPSSLSTSHDARDPKGKGKAKADGQPVSRIYVNCSIGDELTSAELTEEQEAAENPPDLDAADQVKPTTSVRPRPKGFDRLLQSGFTQSEVATLRTQFASIHAERFSAPPSPDSLRNLEDAWIDSNAGEALPGGNAAGVAGFDGGGGRDDFAGMASMLDVLVKGMMVGFFFPLGSLTWLLREGLWNDKWQMFVCGGVIFSLAVGIVMGISGDR